jgi:ABC-type uncharacterized transport system substrate-binding protein
MASDYSVRVLSSFIFDDETIPHRAMGRQNRWFHGFIRSLVRQGYGLGNFDVQFVAAPRLADGMAQLSRQFESAGVGLVICPGTDAAIRWARANATIPTVYFGAHPENNGLELIEQTNICGIRLNLPLMWKGENFAILKRLMPDLKHVFMPLNLDSEFAFPNVRTNFQLFRRRNEGFWIPDQSTYIGHRSGNMLAWAFGCSYREGPFVGCDELARGLAEIPADGSSAIVGFNDVALADGAVNAVLDAARRRALALFWINNVPIVEAGGVADFSSDFESIGYLLGTIATRILVRHDRPSDIGLVSDPGERFTLNLARCRTLGIAVDAEIRNRFHAFIAQER